MKAKFLILLSTCVLCFTGVEITMRLLASRLDLIDASTETSSFIVGPEFGYEPKPRAPMSFRDEHQWRFTEVMNSEGFRGADYSLDKPAGVYRILALGDSVVEAMSVRSPYPWTQVLETILQGDDGHRVQVLNGGVGGYVSWQMAPRLRRHGLAYHPDLLMVMVGWNDLVYSTLPIWTPGIELSQIEAYYAPQEAEHLKSDPWSRFKRGLSHYSYTARWISHRRNHLSIHPWEAQLIARHQKDSGMALNERALALYEKNLETLYRDSHAAGIPMVLVSWPTLLSADLLDDPVVQERLLQTYVHFPLSTRELWIEYSRYQEAQRAFAKRHPDVHFIDAAAQWSTLSRAERLQDFTDMAHLSIAGNRRLAQTVAAEVRRP